MRLDISGFFLRAFMVVVLTIYVMWCAVLEMFERYILLRFMLPIIVGYFLFLTFSRMVN